MNEVKHTPLPFKYSVELPIPAFPKPHIAIFSGLNQTIVRSDYLSEETAAFIVRACNSHDDLVEALENARNKIAEYAHLAEKRGHVGYYMADEQIEKVLSKAKGAA